VIMTRLDRLEETSRWTAQVASVIGRAFSVDLLRRIVPMNEAQLQANLTQLCEHEIIRNSDRAPQRNYVFNHVLVQDVCYRSLLARTRRLYHRRIAECLVEGEVAGQEAESSYPFIAYHAFVGQDWSRAFRYQLLAGEHARDLFANEAAIEHFRTVLQSAEHLPEEETKEGVASATAALGELLTTTGQYEEAGLYLEQARTLAADCGDWETEARVCRWLARLHELRGEYTRGVEWIQQGLVVLEGRETVEMAHLLLTAGLINTRLGNYDTALDQCELSLRTAERLGEVAVLARGYTLLGHLCRLRGLGTVTTWYLQRGLDLYEIAGDINGQAITHDLIATALFHTGEWQEAEREYLQAREISDLIGNRYSVALADNNLGGIALNQGRLDEALDFYQGALHSLEQMGGSLYVQGALHMNLGYTYVRRGEVEPARYHLQTAEGYFEQAQARDWLPEMHRHFAEAALLADVPDRAQAEAEHALDVARELSMRNEEGNSLRLLAQVAIEQGQLERAQHFLDESLAILEQVHDQYEWACSMLTLAELSCEREDAAQCVHALDRCAHIFDRLGATLETQRVQELYERTASRVPSGTED
jgi:tetratricopeptide (TPR) repeat protein